MAPVQTQLKCQTCKANISDIHQGIKCVKCCNIYHSRCVGLSGKNRQEIQKIATIWHCCQSGSTTTSIHQKLTNSPTVSGTGTPPLIQTPRSTEQAQQDDDTAGFKRLERLMHDIKQTLLDQLTDLRYQIANLVTENTQLKQKLQLADENNNKFHLSISTLETEVEYLKEKDNINNIVISGIPDKTNDPLTLTLKILNTIKSTVSKEHINSAQYIGKDVDQSNNQQPRTPHNFILVKLATNRAKQEIIEKKKAFKKLFSDQLGFRGNNIKQIFIRDHLTLNKLKLFRAARK